MIKLGGEGWSTPRRHEEQRCEEQRCDTGYVGVRVWPNGVFFFVRVGSGVGSRSNVSVVVLVVSGSPGGTEFWKVAPDRCKSQKKDLIHRISAHPTQLEQTGVQDELFVHIEEYSCFWLR